MMKNYNKCREFKRFVRYPYAWPGGYEQIMLANDCQPICHKCAKEEAKLILRSTLFRYRDGWEFAGTFINWEDEELICANCGESIPAEYADC